MVYVGLDKWEELVWGGGSVSERKVLAWMEMELKEIDLGFIRIGIEFLLLSLVKFCWFY